MDANESPYNSPYNRYPDPRQTKLREKLARMFSLSPDRIFLGNGSDEAIDLLIRVFCTPGSDRIVVLDPSYGMYRVCADINDVAADAAALEPDFSLNPDRVLNAARPSTRMVFLCSPNNPTSNLLDTGAIRKILDNFRGIVVVDEAYIDFSPGEGLLPLLDAYPGLVLLRTLSKAWSGAGIRFGMALGDPRIIRYLDRVKYPYNVNILTQEKALDLLGNEPQKQEWVGMILSERERLREALEKLGVVRRVHPSDANFLLVQVTDPDGLHAHLSLGGVIVRNRSRMTHCEGCLRFTVGTRQENSRLIELIKTF